MPPVRIILRGCRRWCGTGPKRPISGCSARGFLPGFAYQCGVAVAGRVASIEAVFAARFSYASAMALTAAAVFTLAAVLVALGNERRAHEFGLMPPHDAYRP